MPYLPRADEVLDRSGNVLGVFQMTGAAATFAISGGRGVVGGLDNVPAGILPSSYAAIAKAVTGAYLSSEGNAFSTRTASQIVQENFNPGEIGSPGGPLFGVQFSSLSCSDVVAPGGGSAEKKERSRLVKRRYEGEFERRSLLVPDAVVVAGDDVEPVVPRREVRIGSAPGGDRPSPVCVVALELVTEADALGDRQAGSRVLKLETLCVWREA